MPQPIDRRLCEKCLGMFLNGQPTKGNCPAGGLHQASDFNLFPPSHMAETGSVPGEDPGCFIGCTRVLMADGTTRRIDAIAVGDCVKARDELTGLLGDALVDHVFEHRVDTTLLLQLDGGEVIGTTAEHRFACDGRGFVSAGQLSPNDTLTAFGDTTSRVLATEPHTAPAKVYNLSVAGLHTYFIGGAALWVHNLKKPASVAQQ